MNFKLWRSLFPAFTSEQSADPKFMGTKFRQDSHKVLEQDPLSVAPHSQDVYFSIAV